MKEIILINSTLKTLVDDEDYKVLSVHRWRLHKHGYIESSTRINKEHVKIHRLIMGLVHKDGIEVDHIDNNKFNNQRSNLRFCTRQQNNMNRRSFKNSSSKYKCVTWHIKNKNWVAYITFNKKRIHLGSFSKESDAAKAYNEAAIKYHGEFAKLNEIPSES